MGWQEERITIKVIKVTGDQILDRPLSEVGGKGLFTKELETALLANEIDLAVHSMKDVATVLPESLIIAAVLPREDVRDAFISLNYKTVADLPAGAVVGTSSLRRRAQLKSMRPDLEVVEFRGNVQTRLKKLQDGVADATFLACAGLNRLGMSDRITAPVATDQMLPAAAQGAIGIELRDNDAETRAVIANLNDPNTELCVRAERAFLKKLDGSCRTPIGALAEFTDAQDPSQMRFRGQILTPDGQTNHAEDVVCTSDKAVEIADQIGQKLLDLAGPDFFKTLDQRSS